MLGQHWYHALTRKYIAAFGSLFNDITLIKYNKAHTEEIKRTIVPIVFGPREKYLVKSIEDNRKVQGVYPILSYNLINMQYSSNRQFHPLQIHPKANTVGGTADNVYTGAAYDLTFELSLTSRNLDDAYQIIEQIMPIFTPSYTFSQILIPELGFVKDIPVTLQSISQNVEYEGASFEELRSVEYTLTFSMLVYYYGPVTRSKIIRRAFANTFIDPTLYAGAIQKLNLDNGNNGRFNIDDMVYQGDSLDYCTAAGQIIKWDESAQRLMVGAVQGRFETNSNIKAASTNAVYRLASYDMEPLKVQSIKIEPDPITANVGDPFGYTVTEMEYPIDD